MAYIDREVNLIARPEKNQSLEMHLYSADTKNPAKQTALNRVVFRINDRKNGVKPYANFRAEDIDYAYQLSVEALRHNLGNAEAAKSFDIISAEPKFMRGKTNEDDRGYFRCYSLAVNYDSTKRYPIQLTIKNFWAPLNRTASGGTSIIMKEADGEQVASVYMTIKEWFNQISYAKRLLVSYDNYRVATGDMDYFFQPNSADE